MARARPLRTLIISDLHLAARTGADLLRREAVREPLLAALDGCDRLVLLGDVIELRHARLATALAVAEPVLREIGAALPGGSEVILVPGNHDHHLAAAWLERRTLAADPGPLGLASAVDRGPTDPLAIVADWLAPARVSSTYPGVWLREDVYATHGHYLDRHTTVPLLERIGVGLMARLLREPPGGPATVEDYEATLVPIYAWIHALAQGGRHDDGDRPPDPSTRAWRALTASDGRRGLRRRGLALAFPGMVAGINRVGLGPLRPDLSGPELRRAGLRAFAQVLDHLDVTAAHVIFGHTHRAGPLPGDDATEWRTRAGTAILNTGSWVDQPDFLGPDPARSPYRVGFAVAMEADRPPELINLFDGVRAPVPA